MCAGLAGNLHAAKHARQFITTAAVVELLDPGTRGVTIAMFGYAQMSMPLRCDLRQMGHAQHLTLYAEGA